MLLAASMKMMDLVFFLFLKLFFFSLSLVAVSKGWICLFSVAIVGC